MSSFSFAALATISLLAYSTLILLLTLFSHKPRLIDDSELTYLTTLKNNEGIDPTPHKLPPKNSHDSNTKIELSVVVPCYNETGRLKIMLEEAIAYLRETYDERWEIIIVDDGSKDGTSEYALKLANEEFKLSPHQLKIVKLIKNRGKGGAVTHGMQFISGKYGIFADADGASKFSDVEQLIDSIKDIKGPAIAIGSRAHMVDTDAVVKRSFIRNFLMYSLHLLVFIFGIRDIKDTQCGFKLFNNDSIDLIFPYLHTEGWIFDVEILIIAIRKKIPIKEIPISWHEVDGSKVDLARDSINMAIDLVVTRLSYILGIYKDS